MEMINADQRRKIFGLQKQYRIEKDDLYSIVEQISGNRSISALSKEQAIKVIDRIAKLSGEIKKPNREHRANDAQIGKIRKLEKELRWDGDPKRLQGFMGRVVGVERPVWLTPQQASKVIEALKAMKTRADRQVPSSGG
ncbi:regulatory protein GemA [Cohnella silvisoli]|uniref:Regulatory protein GemA n=1 Tax=Cohnella silvisoli TaxID=2873699 RepID=A0ABV1L2C1_9BACL|nr:regulatory protein GemA [Cohnella silvisoli]MCD9025766.1 regulatory protein GemA [Cohnella silvisoli]